MENELKACILLIFVSVAVGAYAYALLPDPVASHWGISGEPDGYMPRGAGAFFLPALLAALFSLLIVIPRIDPLRANIEAFKTSYHRFVLVVMSFLFIVYLQSILWNLGTEISFNLTMPVMLGVMLFFVGILLQKAKRNWFIGIRTPWTLSSDDVWEKTHMLGAKVFKAVGVASVVSVFLPAYAMLIVIGLLLAASVGLVIYSYVAYARLARKING
ncbi:MAG: SdpI family protein [Candidatus Micrarchaeota archaeon]